MTELTKAEAKNLMDLIEISVFRVIREYERINNFRWLISIVETYLKLKRIAGIEDTKKEPQT